MDIVFEGAAGERDTAITGDLSRGDWATHLPQYACSRVPGPGGSYHLNAAGDAPQYGGVYAQIPSPQGATKLVLTCKVKLQPGVSTSTPVALVIYRPASGAFGYTAVTPASEWQTMRVDYDVVGGEEVQISITVNHGATGSGPQANVLVRDVRARWEGGTSLLASGATLYDISRAPLLHGNFGDEHVALGPRPSCRARAILETDAPRLVIKWHSTLAQFAEQDSIAVRVNGSAVTVLTPPQHGKMLLSEVSLPGEPGTRVEIINGISGDQPLIVGGQSAPIGVYIHNLYLPSNASVRFIRPRPRRRILLIGASIVSGWWSNPPATHAWAAMLRDQLAPDVDVVCEATGWRPLHTIAKDASSISAYVARIVASGYDPTDIVLHLQINDYGLGETPPGVWSAAAYGAGYAALLDAFHEAFPDAVVWCPSAEVREDETTPNQWGNILQDYRDAGEAATVGRPWARYVDGRPALTLADMTVDGLHPDKGAQSEMARYWYETLTA